MTKKIFSLFAMLLCFALQGAAQNGPDSIFVVKNGRIVSSYEVGKDVDNITFEKKQVVEGCYVKTGDTTIELKSAVVTTQSGYIVAYLSDQENVETLADVAAAGHYVAIYLSPTLASENITFSTFSSQFEEDEMFQVMFVDVDKYETDDDYEPVLFSSDDWEDYYTDGTFFFDLEDDKLNFSVSCTPVEGAEAFESKYDGTFTMIEQSTNTFTVDGEQMTLRAAFAEKLADGTAFYLTPGNIDKANDLENCYYYARLFVPTEAMDGNDIDISGSTRFELSLVDNVTDVNNPQTITIKTDSIGSATGTLSVLDRGDGSYTIMVGVEKLGADASRSLQIAYQKGTPEVYDLTVPSNYSVAGADAVDIRSAAVKHDTANQLYTVYLSSKENATTEQSMADADIVITMPDEFVNDSLVHGFSGTDTNAKISVTYDGVTYSKATCDADSRALGGNAKLTVSEDTVNVDFSVFGIKKYSGNLTGHYEGTAVSF